jgi:hypothetical protein
MATGNLRDRRGQGLAKDIIDSERKRRLNLAPPAARERDILPDPG